jgi:hypothetical protein
VSQHPLLPRLTIWVAQIKEAWVRVYIVVARPDAVAVLSSACLQTGKNTITDESDQKISRQTLSLWMSSFTRFTTIAVYQPTRGCSNSQMHYAGRQWTPTNSYFAPLPGNFATLGDLLGRRCFDRRPPHVSALLHQPMHRTHTHLCMCMCLLTGRTPVKETHAYSLFRSHQLGLGRTRQYYLSLTSSATHDLEKLMRAAKIIHFSKFQKLFVFHWMKQIFHFYDV